MICPSHEHQKPGDRTPDRWEVRGKDRCCSYCGSWHPDEFLAFLQVAADPQQSGYIEHTTKSYKIYIHRDGIEHAGMGAIKFYKWHLPQTLPDEVQVLYREALEVSFRKAMKKLDETCLELFKGMGK